MPVDPSVFFNTLPGVGPATGGGVRFGIGGNGDDGGSGDRFWQYRLAALHGLSRVMDVRMCVSRR